MYFSLLNVLWLFLPHSDTNLSICWATWCLSKWFGCLQAYDLLVLWDVSWHAAVPPALFAQDKITLKQCKCIESIVKRLDVSPFDLVWFVSSACRWGRDVAARGGTSISVCTRQNSIEGRQVQRIYCLRDLMSLQLIWLLASLRFVSSAHRWGRDVATRPGTSGSFCTRQNSIEALQVHWIYFRATWCLSSWFGCLVRAHDLFVLIEKGASPQEGRRNTPWYQRLCLHKTEFHWSNAVHRIYCRATWWTALHGVGCLWQLMDKWRARLGREKARGIYFVWIDFENVKDGMSSWSETRIELCRHLKLRLDEFYFIWGALKHMIGVSLVGGW